MEFRVAFVAVAAGAGELLGGYDQFLHALILFVAIDYVTGVLRAAHEKRLSSHVGGWGIVKKLVLFFMVAVANELDHIIGTDHLIRLATIAFFLSNEGISLLENIAALGVPVPPRLLRTLEEMKDKQNVDKNENKNSSDCKPPK